MEIHSYNLFCLNSLQSTQIKTQNQSNFSKPHKSMMLLCSSFSKVLGPNEGVG